MISPRMPRRRRGCEASCVGYMYAVCTGTSISNRLYDRPYVGYSMVTVQAVFVLDSACWMKIYFRTFKTQPVFQTV
jgi:hypothetical protein